jgi:hypothetical protein
MENKVGADKSGTAGYDNGHITDLLCIPFRKHCLMLFIDYISREQVCKGKTRRAIFTL